MNMDLQHKHSLKYVSEDLTSILCWLISLIIPPEKYAEKLTGEQQKKHFDALFSTFPEPQFKFLIQCLNHLLSYTLPLNKLFDVLRTPDESQQSRVQVALKDSRPLLDTLKILVYLVKIDQSGALTKFIVESIRFERVIRQSITVAYKIKEMAESDSKREEPPEGDYGDEDNSMIPNLRTLNQVSILIGFFMYHLDEQSVAYVFTKLPQVIVLLF